MFLKFIPHRKFSTHALTFYILCLRRKTFRLGGLRNVRVEDLFLHHTWAHRTLDKKLSQEFLHVVQSYRCRYIKPLFLFLISRELYVQFPIFHAVYIYTHNKQRSVGEAKSEIERGSLVYNDLFDRGTSWFSSRLIYACILCFYRRRYCNAESNRHEKNSCVLI